LLRGAFLRTIAVARLRPWGLFLLRFLRLDLVQDCVKLALLILRPIYRRRATLRLAPAIAQLVHRLKMQLEYLHHVGEPQLRGEVVLFEVTLL